MMCSFVFSCDWLNQNGWQVIVTYSSLRGITHRRLGPIIKLVYKWKTRHDSEITVMQNNARNYERDPERAVNAGGCYSHSR